MLLLAIKYAWAFMKVKHLPVIEEIGMLQTAWLVSRDSHALEELTVVTRPTTTALRAAGMVKVDIPTRETATTVTSASRGGSNSSQIRHGCGGPEALHSSSE